MTHDEFAKKVEMFGRAVRDETPKELDFVLVVVDRSGAYLSIVRTVSKELTEAILSDASEMLREREPDGSSVLGPATVN